MIRNNGASGSGSRVPSTSLGQPSTSAGSGNDFAFGEGLAGDAGMPGTSWLQNLQSSAGFGGGGAGGDSNFGDLGGSDDDHDSDAEVSGHDQAPGLRARERERQAC